jgi:hypothetical protein
MLAQYRLPTLPLVDGGDSRKAFTNISDFLKVQTVTKRLANMVLCVA